MKNPKKKLGSEIADFLPKEYPSKKEEQLEKKVSVYEQPAVAIARTLRQHGYEIGLYYGSEITKEPDHKAFGILKEGEKRKKWSDRLYLGTRPLYHVGSLYLDLSDHNKLNFYQGFESYNIPWDSQEKT